MRVYEKVRDYLDDKGLKHTVVARKSGISNSTFNAILNGKRTLYADDLRAICLALDVSPEVFIEWKTA
ncbi:MAG: helix-turn-helix transcriptional regulator [Oscillospiraceae bacterium]